MSIYTNLSSSDAGNSDIRVQEFEIRKKITSHVNRKNFLSNCIEEQVLPKSSPDHLKQLNHPFPLSARKFLEESAKQLQYKIYELKSSLTRTHLPHYMIQQLKTFSDNQQANLNQKLKRLCEESPWRSIGRQDLITNLSNTTLSATQMEALSLGLKFDTGESKTTYAELFSRNYNYHDSDVEKGFKQGVTACCQTLSSTSYKSMPRRYFLALKHLRNDNSLAITQADKGGGIIIMNKVDYDAKMMDLLMDRNTYEEKNQGFIEQTSNNFNQTARQILQRSESGKKMIYLLEEAPKAPIMKGLPKIHKQGTPMRPITSGIGSAPHKLAKCLAKALSDQLGSISNSHLTNSQDLLNRLKQIRFRNKQLASFDVKSLFTNVSVNEAMEAVKIVVNNMNETQLPLPKDHYVELISLCIKFGVCSFNEREYFQHNGLPMGSPLSSILACLYMENLERLHYKNLVGNNVIWLRYVDDILIIAPRRMNLDLQLQNLNSIKNNIQFTLEKEIDGKLPFLDVLIERKDDELNFKIYRKPTNKNDMISFYSAHSQQVKSGTVIGFFLRAYRICSECYLEDECRYIMESFEKIGYPRGYLLTLRSKAKRIMSRNQDPQATQDQEEKSFTIVPFSPAAETIIRKLPNVRAHGGKKINELTKPNTRKHTNNKSIVYKIPCSNCGKAYFGETGRGMEKRLKEHKADMRFQRTSNALVTHGSSTGHIPDFANTAILMKNMKKKVRKTIEAAYIATQPNMNMNIGCQTWAKAAAILTITEENNFT